MSIKFKLLLGLAFVVVLGIGFALGMEYKAYQFRSAIGQAFSNISVTPSSTPYIQETSMAKAEEEKMINIDKNIGDEIVLATGSVKVNKSEEKQTLSSKYSTPKVAKEGTKFVIVNLDVTNSTKSEFTFSPDDVFLLVDDQKREYKTYSNSIGAIEGYLNFKTLSPSVKETGYLIYEIPEDAASYGLVTSKAGTKELYTIKLK